MSVEELAEALGVTSRAVRHWEAGTRAVGDRTFGRLLDVLRCGAQDLTGRDPGTESLADLRRDAGLSAEDAASVLRRKRGARGLHISAEKIRDLERGRRVRGWMWGSPETLGQVARMLAQVYQVPDRVVMDAWRHSRPEDPLPVLPTRRARQPSRDSMAAWGALNDWQRFYLTCIFRQDQEAEAEQRHARLAGAEQQSAAQWRRMTLALSAFSEVVGYTRIQERLREAGVHDPPSYWPLTGPANATHCNRARRAIDTRQARAWTHKRSYFPPTLIIM